MKWLQSNNRAAPQEIVDAISAACKEFDVPPAMVCGIVECETNFRYKQVSSAGAVGFLQIKRKFAQDYYRYAGFEFPLEDLAGVRGAIAALRTYQKWGVKKGYKGDDVWRYVLVVHRWGQNSAQAKNPLQQKRVLDVEKHMKRNGMWYDRAEGAAAEVAATPAPKPTVAPSSIPAKAVAWALDKVGCAYSQPQRLKDGIYDCSSLVARAYKAVGAPFTCQGAPVPRSNQEVYDDQYELLWPDSYDKIGKVLGGASVIAKATQPGDLQFLRTSATSRANRITHITMVVDSDTIVHARSTKYGVRTDPIDTYNGKVCALLRFDPTCPLRLGHKGDRVRALQTKLNAKGAGLVVDGDYGRKTADAVAKYGIKE